MIQILHHRLAITSANRSTIDAIEDIATGPGIDDLRGMDNASSIEAWKVRMINDGYSPKRAESAAIALWTDVQRRLEATYLAAQAQSDRSPLDFGKIVPKTPEYGNLAPGARIRWKIQHWGCTYAPAMVQKTKTLQNNQHRLTYSFFLEATPWPIFRAIMSRFADIEMTVHAGQETFGPYRTAIEIIQNDQRHPGIRA
jgi:hypothetical protein